MKTKVLWCLVLLVFLALVSGCSSTDSKSTTSNANQPTKEISPSFVVTKQKGNYNFTKASEELAAKLPALSKDSDKEIRDAAAELLKGLPTYKTLVGKIPEMSSNKQVDFIMHMHFGGDETRQDLVGELISGEKTTKRILSQNQYQMIAVEDNYTEEVDFESLPNALIKQFKADSNYNATLPETHRFIQQIKQFKGIFQYMEGNPKQKVFGYELDPPNRLLKRIFTLNKSATSRTARLDDLWATMKIIHKLRSELAIARTLERMGTNQQKTGVVIMGYLHIHELQPLAEAIGLQSRFYVTVSQKTAQSFNENM